MHLLDTIIHTMYILKSRWNKQFCDIRTNYIIYLWGVIMHIALLLGVLDINFHSPIIQGLEVIPAPNNAPAKRLLLFIADGLRFRTFIEKPPPYLEYIMYNEGSWGISHARMPTESRPGTVAIVAGFYEDPSAIFKGWKENPVDFDSVFNQSHFTWAWGSPDIIPMFTKGNKANVYGKSYPSTWQDFNISPKQTIHLDSWVFEQYFEWLNKEADLIKNKSGIILFFHLLGCDTIGHSRKPISKEYMENMNYIDQKIKEVVQITEHFFGYGSTAYLFTADHGMTNWGSHGSDSTDETDTPLIVWGAGVNKWKFQENVDQRNIAPLISSLIGIPIPVNNEGVLPLQYLSANNQNYRCHTLLNNIKQLLHQIKGNRIISCETSDNYAEWQEAQLNQLIYNIEYYLKEGNTKKCVTEALKAATMATESLLYYRHYQRVQFLIYLSLMWLGWIMLLFYTITGVVRRIIRGWLLLLVNFGFTSLLIILLFKQKSCGDGRLLYYGTAAIFSLWLATRNMIILSPKFVMHSPMRVWIEITGIIFLLITMFLGLMYRSILSIGMLIVTFLQMTLIKGRHHLLFWTGLTLSVFPLLPVIEPHPRVYVGLMSICPTVFLVFSLIQSRIQRMIEVIRLILTGCVYSGYIDGRFGISWIILITTLFCICGYPTQIRQRIQAIAIAFFCPFILLSASYEPFFFLTLMLHFMCWPQQLVTFRNTSNDLLSTEDLTKAAYFMVYTLLCFFGTGNMASISSFDPSWTRHFITIFSPFTMFFLILLKLSIPLLLVGCMSHNFSSPKIFLAVLLLGDCLALPLIFFVTPQGSWLDIGSAISRFIIAVTLPCLLLFLYYISYPLIWFNIQELGFYTKHNKAHIV